jgi:hypothetical protein
MRRGEAQLTDAGSSDGSPLVATGVMRFGRVEVSEADLKELSRSVLIDRLTAGGLSRLSAERIIAIERGLAERGRARAHMQARR